MFCDCLQNKTDHSDATIYLDLGKETATYIRYPNLNAHLIMNATNYVLLRV